MKSGGLVRIVRHVETSSLVCEYAVVTARRLAVVSRCWLCLLFLFWRLLERPDVQISPLDVSAAFARCGSLC